MQPIEYFSDVKKSKLQANVRAMISHDMKYFEGKRVHIIIKRASSKRSIAQNAMWWSWLTLLEKETGEDKIRLHDMFKDMFLSSVEVNPFTGQEFKRTRGSSELNKTEFSEMSEKLVRWCAENLNIMLPLPGENWELQFND